MKTYKILYEPIIKNEILYPQWNIYYYINDELEVKLNYGTLEFPLEPLRFGYSKLTDSL